MAQVNLFKQTGTYTNDGVEKTFTNFYVECGDTLIPIEVRFFEDKATGKDVRYQSRRAVLKSYAAPLPKKD